MEGLGGRRAEELPPVGSSAASSSEGNMRAETGSGDGDKKVTQAWALPAPATLTPAPATPRVLRWGSGGGLACGDSARAGLCPRPVS